MGCASPIKHPAEIAQTKNLSKADPPVVSSCTVEGTTVRTIEVPPVSAIVVVDTTDTEPPKKFGEAFCFKQFSTLSAEITLDNEISGNGSKYIKHNIQDLEPGRVTEFNSFKQMSLLGHASSIKLCVLSPTETRMASACLKDTTIVVWNLLTMKVPVLIHIYFAGK